jgi:membrane dipeptidase
MELRDRALELHSRAVVVDAHCDTIHLLSGSQGRYDFKQRNCFGHLDLPRLRQGGVDVQLFALCVAPLKTGCGALKHALVLLEAFRRMAEANRDDLTLIVDWAGLTNSVAQGKIAALLTIEGGDPLEGRVELLHVFHRLGARGFSMTWNDRNLLADGVGAGEKAGGLTEFGRQVLREVNRLGMIVDAAHLARKAFFELLDASISPVIVSHANAAAVSNHRRNLDDAQIKALRDQGGVIGLTFYPPFVTGRNEACLNDLMEHFCYIAQRFGVEVLGLGSDYDGIPGTVTGLEDVSRLPLLTASLLERGFAEEEIKMILGGNFLRVFSSSLGQSNVQNE